ncbi:MAG: ATP-binding protein [Bacteroidota bacterium]|nr:ATP-binding protein [Bacteroidota bacterium]
MAKLKTLAKLFPVIGITGPRQCGKTTLVKEFIKHLDKDSIYLDLEKHSDKAKLNEPELYLQQYINKCVVIDEIQFKPDLFPLLRSLVDENRVPVRFIILGSASPSLLKQSSESLAGRIAYLELSPFNLLEISEKYSLETHHFTGGYPEALLQDDKEFSDLWLENLIATYIQRDLPLFGLKADPLTIRRLWEMTAWQNGNILNGSSLAKSLNLNYHTVFKYLSYFEQAYLIKTIPPYYINQKKRLVKTPKIYLRDTGILHSLLRISSYDQLLGSPLLGASWEAYVMNQIYDIKSNELDLFFYRTHNGAETDLVLTKGLVPVSCIEIKFSSAPKIAKGFYTCIDDLKTENNFVITPHSDNYPIKNNIMVCNIKSFIYDFLPDI